MARRATRTFIIAAADASNRRSSPWPDRTRKPGTRSPRPDLPGRRPSSCVLLLPDLLRLDLVPGLAGAPGLHFLHQQTPGDEPVDALAALALTPDPDTAGSVEQADAGQRFVGLLAPGTGGFEVGFVDFSFHELELTHPLAQIRLLLDRNRKSQHSWAQTAEWRGAIIGKRVNGKTMRMATPGNM